MKIAIVIYGTRGDVQPMLALSTALMNRGHEIIFCATPDHEALAERYQCPFVPFGPDMRELFSKANIKGKATARPSVKEMKTSTARQIDELPDILRGSDLVLGVGFVLGVHTVADSLGVPYRFVIFYPVLLGPGSHASRSSQRMFSIGRAITNMAIKGFINKKRARINLQPINDVWANWMGEEVIVACDRDINSIPQGVAFNCKQTGYLILPSDLKLPAHVEQFIAAGTPPVYIGFGSNPIDQAEKYTSIFAEVAKITGQRLIISKGWAMLPEQNSEHILYVDEMPFELLFPKLAAVVSHGGTGTVAYAARAGIPQIAFPYMADQFENRKIIADLGIGPITCDFKKISATAISIAITECLTNDTYKHNATILMKKLSETDGLQMTVELLESIVTQTR